MSVSIMIENLFNASSIESFAASLIGKLTRSRAEEEFGSLFETVILQ
jgi:hypothetical protein